MHGGRFTFIHFGYFYSASSSPLLFRGVSDYSIHTVSLQTTMREGLAQGSYVTAMVRLEPATFRTQGTEPTTESLRLTLQTGIRQS